jgi:hypothetical protein
MKKIFIFGNLILLLALHACPTSAEVIKELSAAEKNINERIEELTGAKGKYDEKEGVFKVSFPRTDVSVLINGRKFDPFLGLTSFYKRPQRRNDGHGRLGFIPR